MYFFLYTNVLKGQLLVLEFNLSYKWCVSQHCDAYCYNLAASMDDVMILLQSTKPLKTEMPSSLYGQWLPSFCQCFDSFCAFMSSKVCPCETGAWARHSKGTFEVTWLRPFEVCVPHAHVACHSPSALRLTRVCSGGEVSGGASPGPCNFVQFRYTVLACQLSGSDVNGWCNKLIKKKSDA